MTASVRIRRCTPTKEKHCSFAKGKIFFIMYISMCFYTKRAKKNNVKGYSLSQHVQQCIQCSPVENKLVLFLCLLLPVLSCLLLLSSDVSHKLKPAFFSFFVLLLLLLFCWARGLCILPKCAVCKICATMSELLFLFFCSTERIE